MITMEEIEAFIAKGKALVLRTCTSDNTSRGGFQWPLSGPVECPDWDPTPTCGHGLHGLLDGVGDYGQLSNDPDAKWLLVEVDRAECVEIDRKVKFPRGSVVYCGDMAGAMTRISDYLITLMIADSPKSDGDSASGDSSQLAASGHYSKLAASGDSSQLAASGHSSQLAASGHYSKLAASGDSSQLAASGHYSKLAASGDYSQLAASGHSSKLAASGHSSKLAASGHSSQLAASGDYSKLAASGHSSQLAASGHSSQLAASGDYSKLAASGHSSKLAASGDSSQLAASGHSSQLAASGDYSKLAASGEKSIAVSTGINGVVSAGEDGCIALTWWDERHKRFRLEVAYVGVNGIEPNTLYTLSKDHEFVRVQ